MALDGLSTRAFNMKNLISFFSNLEDKMNVKDGKFIDWLLLFRHFAVVKTVK